MPNIQQFVLEIIKPFYIKTAGKIEKTLLYYIFNELGSSIQTHAWNCETIQIVKRQETASFLKPPFPFMLVKVIILHQTAVAAETVGNKEERFTFCEPKKC